MTDDGLRFVIADKTDHYELELAGVDGAMDLVRNGVPTATFDLDDDNDAEAQEKIWAEGSRCWVFFRGVEKFRGRIDQVPREPDSEQLVPVIEGDMVKLWEWLGWPRPSAALNAQTVEYWTASGTTEAIVKAALTATFTRLGVPWSCAPNLNRGLTGQRLRLRMHPLADHIIPLLDAAGLTLTLEYVTNPEGNVSVVVDVREPETVSGDFTIESGVPDRYGYGRSWPTATRMIVGGRGEGTAREFRQVVDASREENWADIIEVFLDARNTEPGADITVDGREALREGAPQIKFSTELVESEVFKFDETYTVGDLAPVSIGPVRDTFPVTGVSVTDTADNGVAVSAQIGAIEKSADTEVRLARALARLARDVRDKGRT